VLGKHRHRDETHVIIMNLSDFFDFIMKIIIYLKTGSHRIENVLS
jgi:hypothetical protein